jgi:hypothetical protein
VPIETLGLTAAGAAPGVLVAPMLVFKLRPMEHMARIVWPAFAATGTLPASTAYPGDEVAEGGDDLGQRPAAEQQAHSWYRFGETTH